MKFSSQTLQIVLVAVALLVLPTAIWWLTQYDKYRTLATIIAFLDIMPFVLGLVWLVVNYRRSPSPAAKITVSFLSLLAFLVMPMAFWWASRYASRDQARVLPIVIAAVDTVPLVAGMMWFLFLYPRLPNAFGRWINNHPKFVYYLIIPIIFFGYVFRLLHH